MVPRQWSLYLPLDTEIRFFFMILMKWEIIENPIPFSKQWITCTSNYLHSESILIQAYRSRIFRPTAGYNNNNGNIMSTIIITLTFFTMIWVRTQRIVWPAVHTLSPTLAISPHIILLFHLNRTWILLCINCHLLIDEGDDHFSWTTSVDPLDIFILIISSRPETL